MSLTNGAVATMVRGADDYKPTVQIINLKPVGPQGDRFRVSSLCSVCAVCTCMCMYVSNVDEVKWCSLDHYITNIT